MLLAALELFKAPDGPVLADFSDEGAEDTGNEDRESTVWACPISFPAQTEDMSDAERLIDALNQKIAELRNWDEVGIQKTGRAALVDFVRDVAAQLLGAYVLNETAATAKASVPFAAALRIAAQDLKTFYFESVVARPGAIERDSKTFNYWFCSETSAGRVLMAVKERYKDDPDPSLWMTGTRLLVPLDQG